MIWPDDFLQVHLVSSPAVIDGRVVLVFGPMLGGVVFAVLVGVITGKQAMWPSPEPRIPPFRIHSCAILFPLAGGILWFASSLPYYLSENVFLFNLLFLPVMCVGYEFLLGVSEYGSYLLLFVGAPAMCLTAGTVADFIRRSKAPLPRARALVYSAICPSAFVIHFVSLAKRRDTYFAFPSQPQVLVIVGVYVLAIAGLVWSALRSLRHGHAKTPS